MKIEDTTVLLIRGLITQLEEDGQKKVHLLADTFRRQVKEAGELADLAGALVGAELQAENAQ